MSNTLLPLLPRLLLLLLVARFRGAIAFDLSFAGPWDRQRPAGSGFGLGTKIGIGIGIGIGWGAKTATATATATATQLTMPMISFISHFGFIH